VRGQLPTGYLPENEELFSFEEWIVTVLNGWGITVKRGLSKQAPYYLSQYCKYTKP